VGKIITQSYFIAKQARKQIDAVKRTELCLPFLVMTVGNADKG